MRKITRHIIHCSDSLSGDVKSIRHYHVSKGWKDIGYHFIIRPDGVIEQGRPLEQMGAHCKDQNKFSIGTCLIGRSIFTDNQINSLKRLHKTLESIFGRLDKYGHKDFNKNKTCPNFEVYKILGDNNV